MGYACPVCEAPQADGEHLANHMAITAILRDEEHAEWLDEHAPGWEQSGPEDLADRLVEAVPEAEFPQVFEDTTDRHGHDHGRGGANRELPFEQELARQAGSRGSGRGDLTGETREIVAEARELTRQMLDDGGDDEESDRTRENDRSQPSGGDADGGTAADSTSDDRPADDRSTPDDANASGNGNG